MIFMIISTIAVMLYNISGYYKTPRGHPTLRAAVGANPDVI
jgi:hypothetical protein